MSPPCSQDWKFFVFRSMIDAKKTNGRINALEEKLNQRLDASIEDPTKKTIDEEDWVTSEFLAQVVNKQQRKIDRLNEEAEKQQRLVGTLADAVHQMEEALKEQQHAFVKQEVRMDQMNAKMDVDHDTLFGLVSDLALMKLGGSSELSRVNDKIATKAGRKEVEQQLMALRAGGTPSGVPEASRPHNGLRSPEPLIPMVRDAPENALEGPLPRRTRMPLRRKAGYEFTTTQERSGGVFLDY